MKETWRGNLDLHKAVQILRVAICIVCMQKMLQEHCQWWQHVRCSNVNRKQTCPSPILVQWKCSQNVRCCVNFSRFSINIEINTEGTAAKYVRKQLVIILQDTHSLYLQSVLTSRALASDYKLSDSHIQSNHTFKKPQRGTLRIYEYICLSHAFVHSSTYSNDVCVHIPQPTPTKSNICKWCWCV